MLKYSKITVCYGSFYPSELIYFSHFKMRHPVLHFGQIIGILDKNVVQSWLENSFTLYYCTTGQLVGHLSGFSMSPINYPLIYGCHYQSVYLCERYRFIYCNYHQEKKSALQFQNTHTRPNSQCGDQCGYFRA